MRNNDCGEEKGTGKAVPMLAGCGSEYRFWCNTTGHYSEPVREPAGELCPVCGNMIEKCGATCEKV